MCVLGDEPYVSVLEVKVFFGDEAVGDYLPDGRQSPIVFLLALVMLASKETRIESAILTFSHIAVF